MRQPVHGAPSHARGQTLFVSWQASSNANACLKRPGWRRRVSRRVITSGMRVARAAPAHAVAWPRPTALAAQRVGGSGDGWAGRRAAPRWCRFSGGHETGDACPRASRRVVVHAAAVSPDSVNDGCETNDEGDCLPIENAPSIWKVRAPAPRPPAPAALPLPPAAPLAGRRHARDDPEPMRRSGELHDATRQRPTRRDPCEGRAAGGGALVMGRRLLQCALGIRPRTWMRRGLLRPTAGVCGGLCASASSQDLMSHQDLELSRASSAADAHVLRRKVRACVELATVGNFPSPARCA